MSYRQAANASVPPDLALVREHRPLTGGDHREIRGRTELE
jgi:hypothetical protein